jgi:hypothetical protein
MKIVFFLCSLFSLVIAASCCTVAEIPQESKDLYADLLVEIHLLLPHIESTIFGKDKSLRASKYTLLSAVRSLNVVLKGDDMINKMSGDIKKVEGENAGWRMLRIFRRQTRNPFAKLIDRTRLVRMAGVTFPKRGTGFEDVWNVLMDQDKIKFKVEELEELKDLEKFIEARAVEHVKRLVDKIFKDQGGILKDDGTIDFYKWSFEPRMNLHRIDLFNYRQVYSSLSSIKFTRII